MHIYRFDPSVALSHSSKSIFQMVFGKFWILFFGILCISVANSEQLQVHFFAKVYADQSETSPVQLVLEDGAIVTVLKKRDNWVQVQHKGITGWLAIKENQSNQFVFLGGSSGSGSIYILLVIGSILAGLAGIFVVLKKKKPPTPSLPSEDPRFTRQMILVPDSLHTVVIFSAKDKNVRSSISNLYKKLSTSFEELGFSVSFCNSFKKEDFEAVGNSFVFAVDYQLTPKAVKKMEQLMEQLGMPTNTLVFFYNIPNPESLPPSRYLSNAFYLGSGFSDQDLLKIVSKITSVDQDHQDAPVFQGKIYGDALLEMVQLIEIGAKDGFLQINNDAGKTIAFMGFEQGTITRAKTKQCMGEDAVMEILGIHTGRYSFVSRKLKQDGDLRLRPTQVLMEYVRRKDELAHPRTNGIARGITSLVMVCGVLFFSSCSNSEPTPSNQALFTVHGSNTIGEKLMPLLVSNYLASIGVTDIQVDSLNTQAERRIIGNNKGSKVWVDIHSYGSSTGFSSLAWDKCDIAMSSRYINEQEVKKLAALGNMHSQDCEHILALDGIAIMVHPKNPLGHLDIATLQKIYTGQVKDWKELTPEYSGVIEVLQRDEESGTHEVFEKLVMKKRKIKQDAQVLLGNQEMSTTISQSPMAIGYGSVTFASQNKALRIRSGYGASSLPPTSFVIQTEEYPLSRRLYLYTAARPRNPNVANFLQFALAQQGQEIVEQGGFIPQIIKLSRPEAREDASAEYLQITNDALRMSVNFRFSSNSGTLDNRSQKDLHRLVQFIKTEKLDFCKIRLVGFTDDSATEQESLTQSHNQALSVARMVEKQLGPRVESVVGLGNIMPVASNKYAQGRYANQRVEAWLNCPALR
jgi:phosphate transport system substrate-binding protein